MSKFKVRCTETCDGRFIKGKIYNVDEKGHLPDEFGYCGYDCSTDSFESWNKACYWSDYAFELIESGTYELRITCNDGKTTNAVYKVNGKIEKRTEAVCAPSDTYNFNTGAELAINRVLYGTDYNPKDVAVAKPTQPIAPQEDKPRFKVGDRVRATALPHRGFVGTVIGVTRDDIGVEFDKNINGHECGCFGMPRGKKDHCWLLGEDELEPYTEPEQPKEPEPVCWSGKVVCVNTSFTTKPEPFTVGKVYEYINGTVLSNNKCPNNSHPVVSVTDALNCAYVKFIPYLGEA